MNIVKLVFPILLVVKHISLGIFMAMDLINKSINNRTTLRSNLERMTDEERNKYKQFLITELKKLDEQKSVEC